ncbi:MAG TPA: hypothetical protein PKD12_19515 [Nitrospira sp.]|nr:hypothetical protein [Nitrospira sp.]
MIFLKRDERWSCDLLSALLGELSIKLQHWLMSRQGTVTDI